MNTQLYYEIIRKHVQESESNENRDSGQKRRLQITKIPKEIRKIPNGCREPSVVFQRWPTIGFRRSLEEFPKVTKFFVNSEGQRKISRRLQTAFKIM